jgi:MFS family permease
LGPGAAGGLISLVTAPVALVADAASFIASALLLRSVPQDGERPQATGHEAREGWRGLREGGRYVLGNRYLRPLLLSHALANLALGVVWAIVVVYAVRQLGLTAALLGVVLSLGQIGGLAGAACGRRVAGRLGIGRTVVAAFFLLGPGGLLLASAPRDAAVSFLALGWTFENLARSLYSVTATSVRQALVPDRLQARVVGFTTTAGTGAFPLGTAIGGTLAEGLGLRQGMLIGGLISFLPVIPVAASPIRALRELPPGVE